MKRTVDDFISRGQKKCWTWRRSVSTLRSRCFGKAAVESETDCAGVDRLAEKANEGELTPRERAEYQAYIKTSELLALIQLRARLKLRLPIPAE